MKHLYFLLFSVFILTSTLKAEEFDGLTYRVQIAAFTESQSFFGFFLKGIKQVQLTIDQNDIYRYYIGDFKSLNDAQFALSNVVARGFKNAKIIDLEEERKACGTPCPYWTTGRVYSSTQTEELFVETIYYDFDKSTLDLEFQQQLDELYKVLEANPSFQVHLMGHTDQKGSKEYNLALSKRRSIQVRSYLIYKGLHRNRIRTRAFGEGKPVVIAPAELKGKMSEDYLRYNRRVVIAIIDKNGEIVKRSAIK